MNPRRRIKLDGLSDQILIYLHQMLFDDNTTYVQFSKLRTAFHRQPANALRLELDSLVDDDFIDQKSERRFRPTSPLGFGGATTPTYWEPVDGYRLSKKGVARVEKIDDEQSQKLQNEITHSEAEVIRESNKIAEINLDEWEPLPIDRNDSILNDAIGKTEEALKALEQENGFGASQPELKSGMVETIRGNLRALKDGFPSKRSLVEGLLKPLKAAAKIFGTNFVGTAAHAAAKAIAAYLGIPL
jgi:hypothetical protein